MHNDHPDKERRAFFRYRYENPIQYKILNTPKSENTSGAVPVGAVSKNLSASGILFSSKHLPQMSSILELELDYRTSQICQEIEESALIINNKLLGKVVRIEEGENGYYDIGVAFIKK